MDFLNDELAFRDEGGGFLPVARKTGFLGMRVEASCRRREKLRFRVPHFVVHETFCSVVVKNKRGEAEREREMDLQVKERGLRTQKGDQVTSAPIDGKT
ncbi:hypothetical protein MUK42_33016 [Musa troglodytarum]|uniref:Uncharacterized protein n=1 Tax=Musa troglodytarum TaxID=320322 RepID=A0A9E7HY87_9LILI|nr:hypothetical protein MUK42_33016 [Musa troglodytarum]